MKRIYHPWNKWECFPAGFYESQPKDKKLSAEEGEFEYRDFLKNIPLFKSVLERVITEWKYSCEHYLSNENMNRIAWLGQASMCLYKGIPSCFRGGYNLLTDEEKKAADLAALEYLNKWLAKQGEPILNGLEEAGSKSKNSQY